MKGRFLFLCTLSALLLFSVSSFAGSNERTKNEVHDVGWVLDLNFDVPQITVANVATHLLVNSNQNETDNTVDFIDPGSAVMVEVYEYKKMKFVSHNRTENRRRSQLYGKTQKEYRTANETFRIDKLPDIYSNYKEQIKTATLYTPAEE